MNDKFLYGIQVEGKHCFFEICCGLSETLCLTWQLSCLFLAQHSPTHSATALGKD